MKLNHDKFFENEEVVGSYIVNQHKREEYKNLDNLTKLNLVDWEDANKFEKHCPERIGYYTGALYEIFLENDDESIFDHDELRIVNKTPDQLVKQIFGFQKENG